MNKKLWKLASISDRLWLIASSIAMEASKWGTDGRRFAVVAEETRTLSHKITASLENGFFEPTDIDKKFLTDMATLALNAALEASRGGHRGKGVAICAEEIRNLVVELAETLEDNKWRQYMPPLSSNLMTSIDNRVCFMQFSVDGYRLIENLNFIQEVVTNEIDHDSTTVKLRGSSIPIIDCFSLLGKKNDNAFYLILRTPWAKTNEIFAVAVDEPDVNALFYSPVGIPVSPVADMPLSKYVREC